MGHVGNSTDYTTLGWFGATTFRLRTRDVTIFLDTWLDKPSVLPKYLAVDDVTEADYIFISHAHFDHLPGADRIAIRTGAIVIANGESIHYLRKAGPSLHCLMPEDHFQVIDTATVYTGSATPYTCSLDITFGMKHGLLRLGDLVPPKKLRDGQCSFIEYIGDRERDVFSHCDGGPSLSAHLGAYDGVMRDMQPKPDVAILAIAGRANFNGQPFNG
ncbi:hypothetical protein COCVIDRAFT_41746 [Bipolaris victoriae FI3]|uniref:Metallo-beta-lactamase domain-containing protein n=1 Tax=Bipolaris victoriae (strain FI3) TaxID=930091 RepID=W7E5U0_BIPV3|nr:hypothetical protein COCVIDRAFT_41746 [Bipolaris victoriae FI3]